MTYGQYFVIAYATITITALTYALYGERIRNTIRRWR